jgi:phosphoserine phosphatase RsbU/P
MKVLVAEDDLTSSAILEDHLRDWGYAPIIVSHGKEALQVLKGPDAPHLAVLDWMMPYLSGLELCQAVGSLQKAIPPYLILLSAKAHKQEVVRALQAGAQDYITKPFDPNELHADSAAIAPRRACGRAGNGRTPDQTIARRTADLLPLQKEPAERRELART